MWLQRNDVIPWHRAQRRALLPQFAYPAWMVRRTTASRCGAEARQPRLRPHGSIACGSTLRLRSRGGRDVGGRSGRSRVDPRPIDPRSRPSVGKRNADLHDLGANQASSPRSMQERGAQIVEGSRRGSVVDAGGPGSAGSVLAAGAEAGGAATGDNADDVGLAAGEAALTGPVVHSVV